jgi:hypothetical protein
VRNAFLLLLALAVATAAASCGGGGAAADDDASAVVETMDEVVTTPAPAGSIRALLDEKAGEDVALVLGTSDFAVGENRVTFLVIGESGQLVDASRARVYVAPGDLDMKPTPALETTAENLPIGAAEAAGDDGFDAPSVWVTHVELDAPGLYSLLVEPEGAQIQAVGQIEVRSDTAVPGVGEKAIPSDTPTLEDGFPEEITTATPPDLELLRYSVKQSLEDGVPFVVTFATPKYCESRVCGPVVDIVDEVRTRLDGSGVRFIHVEIYENNDPNRGFNRWVREWNLPTEPYTFLVDGEGTIKSKFEGLLTVGELEEAVRAELL